MKDNWRRFIRPTVGSVMQMERGKRSEACDMSGGGEPFATLFIVYFYKYRKLSGQLAELNNQLDESLKKGGEDSVLVYSDEPAVRQLAARVNRLLELQGSLTARARLQEERERRMLVNISHDLKTPLTVVYGYGRCCWPRSKTLRLPSGQRWKKYMPKPGMCWICCCSFLIWPNWSQASCRWRRRKSMCVKYAEASWRGIMKCFRMRVLRWKHPFRRRSCI